MINRKNIDMLNGNLWKNIFIFTVPIALSSMLQQLFNSVDTAIVGYFDTSASLAAIGTNSEIIALIISISSGLSVGVNVLLANKLGQKKTSDIADVINESMSLAVIIGIIGFVLGQIISFPILSLIKTPSNIIKAATVYLRIYFCSYPFLMIYDFGSAVLRAHGNSRQPFSCLIISAVVNVILNIVFVVVFKLGVYGVAIATAISTALSAFLVIRYLKNYDFSFSIKNFKIKSFYALPIFKIGIPSALQGAVFCFANIFVQSCINRFGSTAIAGSTIAMNYEYFTYYVITAFGQASTTFTSQNFAANQRVRVKKILKVSIALSLISSLVFIAPIVVFRQFFAGIFTTQNEVVQYACTRILLILAFEPLCNFYEVPSGVLRGMGHSAYPAFSAIVGTCLFRILWCCTVFNHFFDLKVLYLAFPLSWVLTILLVALGFFRVKN